MSPIKAQKLALLQARFKANTAAPQRLIIVGETVSAMGTDLAVLTADNQRQGFPCELLRAVSRCLFHA